jgi:hypothetical protein
LYDRGGAAANEIRRLSGPGRPARIAADGRNPRDEAALLIDSTHRRWILGSAALSVVAVVVYLVCYALTPGGLTGGSTVGLWYGTIGSVLMVLAGALSLHRRLPARPWAGRRSAWLRGHLWFGTVAGVFLLCHARVRLGGPLTAVLSIATVLLIATGWLGVLFQSWLPRLLWTRVRAEAPYEQVPHLCQVMRRRADLIVDEVCGPVADAAAAVESTRLAARVAEDGRAQLRGFYEHDIRPFLAPEPPPRSPMLNALQTDARFSRLAQLDGLEEHAKVLNELIELCRERRQLREQERLHRWLHAWLALHIPLSVLVLVLGVVHVVTALYF